MSRRKPDVEMIRDTNGNLIYKINGDYMGDIVGDNIIVILMDGDLMGNVTATGGDVVLINGDIMGDVVANKVLCPHN